MRVDRRIVVVGVGLVGVGFGVVVLGLVGCVLLLSCVSATYV